MKVEDRVRLEHGDGLGFRTSFAAIDLARLEGRVDSGTRFFALFDAGAEIVGLLEGHPPVAQVAERCQPWVAHSYFTMSKPGHAVANARIGWPKKFLCQARD